MIGGKASLDLQSRPLSRSRQHFSPSTTHFSVPYTSISVANPGELTSEGVYFYMDLKLGSIGYFCPAAGSPSGRIEEMTIWIYYFLFP